MEGGFVKADSNNLPSINFFMVNAFLQSDDRFNVAEVRGSKASSSTRENYGDNAVGYVQLKRDGPICTVKGKVCPEHKVRSKDYSVLLIVNEAEEVVQDVSCTDCPAAAGGCKHALAFLGWVHRRSEEPSPTEICCYWKKTVLSGVGTSKRHIEAKEFFTNKKVSTETTLPDNSTILVEFLTEAKEKQIESQLGRYHYTISSDKYARLSLFKILLYFKRQGQTNVEDFLLHAKEQMSEDLCKSAEIATRNQTESSLWHELRYARVTASKLHEVAHCKTPDGTLVELIIGAEKLKDTRAMKRGRKLEKQ